MGPPETLTRALELPPSALSYSEVPRKHFLSFPEGAWKRGGLEVAEGSWEGGHR